MNIEVKNEKSQIAVAMKVTAISMEQIAEIAAEGYAKLMGYLAEQGQQIAGVPYLAYMNGNEDYSRFDVELGIPVQKEVAVSGEFYMSKTCEGKAVTATHKGAYKDIEIAYTALMGYMAENKLESTGVYYDYYLNDPADTPESELLTKVVFPIK